MNVGKFREIYTISRYALARPRIIVSSCAEVDGNPDYCHRHR
jgi:hypothetical protein